MHGRHLKKRGRWWHYYRNRPQRYADVEARSVITFALRTTSLSEAKLKAAEISLDLERQWESAALRGVSLLSQSASKRYVGAIASNKTHGFQPQTTTHLSDADLLNRLRFLIAGQTPSAEGKAILGLIEKPKISILEAYDRFWDAIEDEWLGFSHDQIRCKRNVYLKSIRHFEEAVGKVAFYDVKRTHALEFRSWWIKRKKENGFKSNTANRELDCLRRLYRVIYDIDSIETKNPFTRVRLKADVSGRRAPLTSDQIRNGILASGALDGLHSDFQLLLNLVINTGMRPIEAIGLEHNDIIFDHDVPHVHVRQNPVRVLKSPHSERLIPLLGVSLDAGKELYERGGWGKRLGKSAYATTVITKHLKTNASFQANGLTMYSLRHWFQDQLTQLSVVDRVQCQLMGHKLNRPTYGDGMPLDMLRDIIAKFAL